MSVREYLPFNLPGRRGLAWIGGTVALGVVGVLELPIVVVLAALPVIDANVGTDDADEAPARRTGAATATAPKRATSKRRSTAAPRGRAASTTGGRRSSRTRGASAQTTV